MREPPSIEIRPLMERVRRRYGLPVSDAEFIPLGNDSNAWAFRLSAGPSLSWFLKVLRRVDHASLEVPRYLVEHGVEHLVPPLPTLDGFLHDPGEPFSFVLYPFVEGRTGGEGGLTRSLQIAVGRLMRRIHDTDVEDAVAALMRRERFEPPSLELARRIGELVRSDQPEDPSQGAFGDLWRDHESEIDHIIGGTEALGAHARDRAHEFVVCHADIHAWNVLVQPTGDFVVVDWDEVLMAPRARPHVRGRRRRRHRQRPFRVLRGLRRR